MTGPALEDALRGLDDAEGLRLLVLAWRRDAAPMLEQAIREWSERHGSTQDWDLDRFDVLTLPRVLLWCVDSGPTSSQLDVVLDRIVPFLPDPRAQAPLEALAEKSALVGDRARALAVMNRLEPSPRSTEDVLTSLNALRSDADERARHLNALVIEPQPERRAVLADLLADRGEPLGEFVSLQLGRDPQTAPSERERALWHQHGIEWISRFIGPWAAQLDFGNGSSVRDRVRFEGGVPTLVKTRLFGAPGPGWRHVQTFTWSPTLESDEPELRVRLLATELTALLPSLANLTAPAAVVALAAEHGPWPALQTLNLQRAGGMTWGRLIEAVHAFPSVTSLSIESGLNARGLATAFASLKDRPLEVFLIVSEEWGATARFQFKLPGGRAWLGAQAVPAKKARRGAWKKLLAEVVKATGQRIAVASGVEVDPALRPFCVMPDA